MDSHRLEGVLHHLRGLIRTGAASASDGQLLERFAIQHDNAAFELLVRRHGPLVWNVCRRLLRGDQDAEDAFQATFLVLIRRAKSLQRNNTIAGWLYAVARRVALRTRGQTNLRRQREWQAASRQGVPLSESSADLREFVDVELSRLPEKYRLPLILCYLQGKTQEEAAAELHWPLGTLKSRVLRGRARLRKRLTRLGITLSAALTGPAGALPEQLVDTTIGLAQHLQDGSQIIAHTVSVKAISLAKEVLQSMSYVKIKSLITFGLVLVLLAGGIGIAAHRGGADRQSNLLVQHVTAGEPPEKGASAEKSSTGKVDNDADLQEAWASLAGTDEAIALRALLALSSRPGESVAFLQQRLRPVKGDPKRIADMLAKLDSEDFDTRKQATEDLEFLGDYAVPHLERALVDNPSLEVRKRIEQILVNVRPPATPMSWVRCRRAIALLEHIDSDESRKLLEQLTQGRSKALPTQDAESALDRLTDKSPSTIASRWADLSGKDESKMLTAMLALAVTPKETVALIRKQVDSGLRERPADADDERIKSLIKELGADDYTKRMNARAALVEMGPRVAELGKQALEGATDPEIRRSLQEVIQSPKLAAPAKPPEPASRLPQRAAILLEHINTPEAQALLKDLRDPKEPPPLTSLSPDGSLKAVVAEKRNTIDVFNVSTGKISFEWQHKDKVLAVTFSPDGKLIASAGVDGQIRLVDGHSGKHVKAFTGHMVAVTELTFSSDSKTLTSVDSEGNEMVWDLTTGKPLK